MEQTEQKQVIMEQERQVVGHRMVDYFFTPQEMKEDNIYKHILFPEWMNFRVVKKSNETLKVEYYHEAKCVLTQKTMDYKGFYQKVTVPVYNDEVEQ
jgi:hypothetical protein